MALHRVFLGILLLPVAAATHAAPDILPGLWESSVEVSSASGQYEQAMAEAQKMLAELPAEQREMMEQMMASRGIHFDLASRTVQTCLTQDAIDDMDIAQTRDGCTQSVEEESPDRYVMTLQCDDAETSGEGEFVVHDDKHYTGTIVMQTAMNGQADTLTMKQEGRWLDSDCGAIQPR